MLFDFIRAHQMNIMLALCAVSAAIMLLLFITKFIPKRRKQVLIAQELMATLLLWFDRLAYVYSGDVSHKGYVMVRLSNFLVFFLTSGLVYTYNRFVINTFREENVTEKTPLRLRITQAASLIWMLLAIIAAFTGLYYTFDEQNVYHRGPAFLLSYVVPVLAPLIQLSVILNYRKKLRKFIAIALSAYIILPVTAGIIQLFSYGISITNMAMVVVSILLYIFTYLDINDEVERVHIMEMEGLKEEQKSIFRLFDQTATAFADAVERGDEYTKGRAVRIASVTRKIAEGKGYGEEGCEDAYYAALLHDVGSVILPDGMKGREEGFTPEEEKLMKQKPVVSGEILSRIKEYPQLASIAGAAYENYDGTGYPSGLSGEDIPEIARMISVARAYDDMTNPRRKRNIYPSAIVREELVKGAGTLYDPEFSDIMVKLMDSITYSKEMEIDYTIESELNCGAYRDEVSAGIEITEEMKKISFTCETSDAYEGYFSSPSIIVFDSFDRRTHSDLRSIRALSYLEYAELWFDGHSILTGAKNMKVDTYAVNKESDNKYLITVSRCEDHVKLLMKSAGHSVDVIIALPDKTKSAYIGITGENCHIKGITIQETGKKTGPEDIERIAEETSFIERMESDVPNVQVDRWRSAYTDGIPVEDRLRIDFHSMSLPSANLVWHCPYIVLFHSKDGKVNGEEYREYAMMKINGESDIENKYSKNRFIMKKSDAFGGWEEWKQANRAGLECKVEVRKRGNRVSVATANCGIYLENITTVPDEAEDLYIAITGDQVALTDIRVR